MYRDDGTKIGTKTVTQGAGLQRQDGTRGNHVSMQFNPPKEQPKTQQQQLQQNYNNSYGTMGGGVTAPKISYETPSGDKNFSRILRNLATSRNAKAQQSYDKMNVSLYNQQQNRYQKEMFQNQNINNSNQQFDRTMDFNTQKLKQQQAVKNVMTPYQQQQTRQAQYNSRVKNFDDEIFKSQMPQAAADSINDRDYNIAKQQFLNSGIMPNFEKYDGDSWFGDDYRVVQDKAPIAESQQNKSVNTKTVGNKTYSFENGKWYETI